MGRPSGELALILSLLPSKRGLTAVSVLAALLALSTGVADVVFLDFDVDFDTPQRLRPIAVDRDFWRRTLDVAFGDMAELVAPAQVFLCEGEPGTGVRTDFDAHCLRTIFGVEYPDTEFLGVGNDRQVQTDAHGIGRAVEALAPGTRVQRVIDSDDRSSNEVAELRASGTRVLGRRHLEAYLLDDEVLEALCVSVGQPDRWTGLKAAKDSEFASSTSPPRNNPRDDLKSCSGGITNAAKRRAIPRSCGWA